MKITTITYTTLLITKAVTTKRRAMRGRPKTIDVSGGPFIVYTRTTRLAGSGPICVERSIDGAFKCTT